MDGDFKGDFTRDSFAFDPLRLLQFSRVLMQQGRVQLDADWNEQTDLLLYALRRLITDLVGPHWGTFDFDIDPTANGGIGGIAPNSISPNSFRIGQLKDHGRVLIDFSIGYGRYYVDGILAENPAQLNYTKQQPASAQQLVDGQQYWVYLDVWERQVTFLEDGDIREVALGENGPDTTTRAEVVWQVKALNDPALSFGDIFTSFGSGGPDTGNPFQWIKLIEDTTQQLENLLQSRNLRGKIKARSKIPPDSDEGPCITPPASRFRGDENQLYRVEIHTGGTAAGGATFKWSRENGSVVFPIEKLTTDPKGTTVILGNLGRDDRFTLESGEWVEIVDDDYVLQVASLRGDAINPLLQVDTVDRMNMRVTLKGTLAGAPFPGVGQDPKKHPLLRRWDQKSGSGKKGSPPKLDEKGTGTINIVEDTSEDGWIILEDGVQVQFQPGDKPTSPPGEITYRTGDYWLIPARTIIGDVLWPQETDPSTGQPYLSDHPQALPPHGVEHHYALLAAISFEGNKPLPIDLRYMVPPLGKLAVFLDIASGVTSPPNASMFRNAGL